MGRKLIVIKVGGAGLGDPGFLEALGRRTRTIVDRGDAPLIVHGGGPDIGRLHDRLAVPFEQIDGLRITRGEGMDLVVMVLCGLLNKRVVALLVRNRIRAVGVSGVDDGVLRASYLDPEIYGEVGRDPEVQPGFLFRLLDQGYVPVIAPVALGPAGTPINVNADVAAQAIAVALDAAVLEFVTDTPGVLRGDAVLQTFRPEETETLISSGVVRGGMVPKVRAARAALESGVARVRVGDFDSLEQETATEAVLI